MKVKIKKLNDNATIPAKVHSTDAGFDLTATSKLYDKYGNVSYGTGLAFEIPEGFVGLLFPRSSNCKKDLLMCNSVGVLDSCYRGEVFFKLKPSSLLWDNEGDIDEDGYGEDTTSFDYIDEPDRNEFKDYNIGDKIGQIIILPYPEVEFEETSELSASDRGMNGFGSSGK